MGSRGLDSLLLRNIVLSVCASLFVCNSSLGLSFSMYTCLFVCMPLSPCLSPFLSLSVSFSLCLSLFVVVAGLLSSFYPYMQCSHLAQEEENHVPWRSQGWAVLF